MHDNSRRSETFIPSPSHKQKLHSDPAIHVFCAWSCHATHNTTTFFYSFFLCFFVGISLPPFCHCSLLGTVPCTHIVNSCCLCFGQNSPCHTENNYCHWYTVIRIAVVAVLYTINPLYYQTMESFYRCFLVSKVSRCRHTLFAFSKDSRCPTIISLFFGQNNCRSRYYHCFLGTVPDTQHGIPVLP